jgi:hypothetical protein
MPHYLVLPHGRYFLAQGDWRFILRWPMHCVLSSLIAGVHGAVSGHRRRLKNKELPTLPAARTRKGTELITISELCQECREEMAVTLSPGLD